ncbi:MAG: hypothetical protein JW891_00600 [Candidatus Lokiarchaeota archaeon]|nr:hypothetical protein [Candidatus Lokiarchaeota archaeon]
MDHQRILKEAQKIAAKYSFWMVSGNIAHLFGFVQETPDVKFELEVKFDEDFPESPPRFIFHDQIKELLGDFRLERLDEWNPSSSVVDIMDELKGKIYDSIQGSIVVEEIIEDYKNNSNIIVGSQETEDYITPDLNAYPSDVHEGDYITPSNVHRDYDILNYSEVDRSDTNEPSKTISESLTREQDLSDNQEPDLAIETELGLIQQAYAFDQRGKNRADINIYITITITKTFIIGVDFSNYPQKPTILLPEGLKSILGIPDQELKTINTWNENNPPHIVDALHDLEARLFFVQDIEQEAKKITGEYKCDIVPESVARLKVHLLTYGFKNYFMEIDLSPYPKPPIINLTGELQDIIQIPVKNLNAYKNWRDGETEPVEIVREISWLVDKNSRINFEIVLLRDHYKDLQYDHATSSLRIDMKGKMQSEDIVFQFEIFLPREYPLKLPEIKVLNDFEIESRDKIKNNLQSSFKRFFDKWTPFTYLVDLFDAISNNIFEVSVVSCVICHKIECPSCSNQIAGDKSCHIQCPYCERSYHEHCWNQTIISFGKCGFCLKTPPSDMMP